MLVTKLGHSCILVEKADDVVLFDPGAWASQLDVSALHKVDQIVYTHEHQDHFTIDILKELLLKFPEAIIVANDRIAQLIADAGIDSIIQEETNSIQRFTSPHENLPIPGAIAPEQNGYHFLDVFTSPGDSHSFSETKSVLAMPFIAPWGKTGDAIDKVLELKPKYVLPIHDWHYSDEARMWLDNLLSSAFEGTGILLLDSAPGIVHEIVD